MTKDNKEFLNGVYNLIVELKNGNREEKTIQCVISALSILNTIVCDLSAQLQTEQESHFETLRMLRASENENETLSKLVYRLERELESCEEYDWRDER